MASYEQTEKSINDLIYHLNSRLKNFMNSKELPLHSKIHAIENTLKETIEDIQFYK